MEPKKRMGMSLPPHYLAVQVAGVFAVVLGSISLFSNLRQVVIGIAPWLGITWVARSIFALGVFILVVNGSRLIARTRRTKPNG